MHQIDMHVDSQEFDQTLETKIVFNWSTRNIESRYVLVCNFFWLIIR